MDNANSPSENQTSTAFVELQQRLNECRQQREDLELLVQMMLANGYSPIENAARERKILVPTGDEETPLEIAYAVGFEVGLFSGVMLESKYRQTEEVLNFSVLAIEVAASCENGSDTRKALKRALASLNEAVKLHRATVDELKDNVLGDIDLNKTEQVFTYCSKLTILTTQYVQTKKRAERTQLLNFISEYSQVIRDLLKDAVKPNKEGRPPDPIATFVGEYGSTKQVKRGKNWEIGKELFDELQIIDPADKDKKLKEVEFPPKSGVAEKAIH